MDSDTDYSLTQNKGYTYALNLRPSGYGKDGTMHNIKGSLEIADHSENGTMTVVGMYAGSDNKMYAMLARQDGLSKIIEADIVERTSRVVIQDSQHLRFDLLRWKNGEEAQIKYLLNIDQVGDMLFISSDEWEYPRCISLNTDYSTGFALEDIVLAKKPPSEAPQITSKTPSLQNGDDGNIFVSFAYRYKYSDGNYSALSFYSDTAFSPKDAYAINAQRENTGMVNRWEKVALSVNSGGKNVTDVEVFAREHGSSTAYKIYTVNKKKSGISNDSDITGIEYKFSKNYPVLGEEETQMLFSNVPKFPKAQTAAGNRIIYGNYKEGHDIGVVDFEVRKVQKTLQANQPGNRNTAISLFKYKVAAIFLNDYNEATTALLPVNETKSEAEVLFSDRLFENSLQVVMKSPPPSFATKVKFAVKSPIPDFEVIQINNGRVIGEYAYLHLSAGNINKVREGDKLIKIDKYENAYNEYLVEEVKQYDVTDGVPRKGLYAKVFMGSQPMTLNSTGSNIDKTIKDEGDIDAVGGSTNPARYNAQSGYSGNGQGGWQYRSAHNGGRLLISDFGPIKEGDEVSLNISFYYEREWNTQWGNQKHPMGTVSISSNIYASKDYADIGEFISASNISPMLVVSRNGNDLWMHTNALYLEHAKNSLGGEFDLPVITTNPNDPNEWSRIRVYPTTRTILRRGIAPVIFRTKNKNEEQPYYFETHKVYKIVNGKIIGDSTENGNPVFNIDFYNGYCWENGVESYKIKDGFNEKALTNNFRPSDVDAKGYRRTHRKNDLTYSGLYNYELGLNNLSEFNPTLANWKSLPTHYGQIQRIISTDGDITVFCNDKVISQFYGKSLIADLRGNENLALSKEVLGDYLELPYTFGTQHPESVVKSPDGLYFVDAKRTRYLFKADKQIIELNPEGSGHLQKGVEEIRQHQNFPASYHHGHGEVNFGLGHQQIVVFNPQAKGFSHYYNFSFEYLLGMNGLHFTGHHGKLFQDEATEFYNVFAGGQSLKSKFNFVVNADPANDKIFQAIKLNSNNGWDTEIRTNLTATKFSGNAYHQRESFFQTYIYRDTQTTQNSKGVGVVQSIIGKQMYFSRDITVDVCVGDVLAEEAGRKSAKITNISGNIITVENPFTQAGAYCYAVKQHNDVVRPDGAPMRGRWMEVGLSIDSVEPAYLNSVTTEVEKSR